MAASTGASPDGSSAGGARVTLMGDRFYGAPALIEWRRAIGWGWRPRCKQDLLVLENGAETTLAECFARGDHLL